MPSFSTFRMVYHFTNAVLSFIFYTVVYQLANAVVSFVVYRVVYHSKNHCVPHCPLMHQQAGWAPMLLWHPTVLQTHRGTKLSDLRVTTHKLYVGTFKMLLWGIQMHTRHLKCCFWSKTHKSRQRNLVCSSWANTCQAQGWLIATKQWLWN